MPAYCRARGKRAATTATTSVRCIGPRSRTHGELIGCAYRTPPFKVGVTVLPEAAIAPLVADLAATYPGAIAGFSGPDPTVSNVATAWVGSAAARGP